MRQVLFVFLVAILPMLFFGVASAKQKSYQAAPFKATYCFFDGEECEDLPTYVRVITTLEKNKVSGFKKNEKILSIKTVDQKAGWEKDEILILREKYKKKYIKALRAYIEFADQASSQKKLLPRKKIASFKYAGNFQTFRTFSRFEDDHYLVITSSKSRVVFNRSNAERLLNFLNNWDFEGEIQAANENKL